MSIYPIQYVRLQADTIGNCFLLSARDNIDSDDFCKQFLTSEWGISILTDNKMIEFSDYHYMYEGLTINLKFKSGKHYNDDILYYTGYLYKYWVSVFNDDPRYIYKIAPIRLIANRFNFYHTQDWNYVIEDIKSRPYK